ncbi:MAG: hypothetical protein FJ308_23615 [Planctomycetes bacterium]|nr:hypothetical protein [Planctomycetota bacterium]
MSLPTVTLDPSDLGWKDRLIDAGFSIRELTLDSPQHNRIQQRFFRVSRGNSSVEILLSQRDKDRSPSLTLMSHLPGCSADFAREVQSQLNSPK